MKQVATAQLIGPALDWAVAKCEGRTDKYWMNDGIYGTYSPTTYWGLGGPIIERERIETRWNGETWIAGKLVAWFVGHAPLVVAMRCYVASRLGEEIEVPEELLDDTASIGGMA